MKDANKPTTFPIKKGKTPIEKAKTPLDIPQLAILFEEELTRRYWSEKSLLEMLPELENAATSYELVLALQSHYKITLHQIQRLVQLFGLVEQRAIASRYEAMEALLEKASHSVSNPTGFQRDDAISEACKRIALHKIAAYEKMCDIAGTLGYDRAVSLLKKAVQYENDAHLLFSQLKLKAIYSDS